MNRIQRAIAFCGLVVIPMWSLWQIISLVRHDRINGALFDVNVNEVESTSVAVNVPVLAVSSFVVIEATVAMGASLTAVTVIETVAAEESSDPSLALNVNESLPLKLAVGV